MTKFDQQAGSDATAGVFSLTQIRHLMRVEFSRAQRYGYAVACIIIGVDRLDQVRDLYGFEFKEAVLHDVVELLVNETRTCDYLGRLIDDRLMAILPHTSREGGEVTARRILNAGRGLRFTNRGEELGITLSVGISHFEDENTMFFDSLVEAAERGLDEAASQGGDAFHYVDPGPPKVQ